MNNVVQRVLTGLIGAPLVLWLIYLGNWPFLLAFLAVAWVAQYEFYSIAPVQLGARHIVIGMAGGALIVFHQFGVKNLFAVGLLLFIGLFVYDVFDKKSENSWQQTVWMIAGVVYPTWLFSFLVSIRMGWDGMPDREAMMLTITPLVLVWATDSLAYFAGRSFGKRPLAPHISPKKTWEGAIAGFLGALLAVVILKLTVLDFLSWPQALVLGVIAGIGGQIGDLIESSLKRQFGVKDSGAILPGHGGFLDRIDGLLLVIPLSYLSMLAFGSL